MLYRMLIRTFIFLLAVLVFSGCSSRQYVHSGSSGASKKTTTQTQDGNMKNSKNMHRATMRPYTVLGKKYYPTKVSIGDAFSGIASWYGPKFHNKLTSNGERYNMYAMTAAHKTLPMNTMLRVTNLENNKQIVVRINDRGPFVKSRIIDLSKQAAHRIDMIKKGTAPVRIEVIGFNGVVGSSHRSVKSVVLGNFAVQIGAFRNKDGAYSYAKRYTQTKGRYNSKVVVGDKDGQPLYRVFLTGFKSEDEARDYKSKDGFSGSFIVRE